jgi:murein DD-endopeptidase MepM/ murein hydrolase activator NlpD
VGALLVIGASLCAAWIFYLVSTPVTEVAPSKPRSSVPLEDNYPIITITPTPPSDQPVIEAADDGPRLSLHQSSLLALGETLKAKSPAEKEKLLAVRRGILVWPTRDTKVNSGFGYRVNPVSGAMNQLHRGIDLRAACGTGVLSAGEGLVTFADWTNSSGNTIKIRHGNLTTRYAHLSELRVSRGARVKAGQLIGLSGDTGRQSTGPHLHFEVWKNGAPKNPLAFKFRYMPNAQIALAGMSCGGNRAPAPSSAMGSSDPAESDDGVDDVLKTYGKIIGR